MAKRQILKDNELPHLESEVEIDPKVYNEVARCARILSVQLIDSSFSVAPSFFDEDYEAIHGVDFSEVHASFNDTSRISTCIFQLEAFKKKGRRKVFQQKDRFIVYYNISTDCDASHAIAFTKKVGLMACYPYFRAHVASTASLANAEIPILPTISAMPVKGKIKKEGT